MESEQETDSVALALAQPLILDRIVDHVVHCSDDELENEKLYRKALVNLRLVSKGWKESVNRVLETGGEPLFIVTLTEDNSLNESRSVREDGKELDNFMKFLPTATSTPTFRLVVQDEVFRWENYESLLNCFTKCGRYLKELILFVPFHCGSLPGLFPNLKLPSLRLLKCHFLLHMIDLEDDDETLVRGPINRTMLLQSLLNAVPNLKELSVFGILSNIRAFHLLGLPDSLTKLGLAFHDVGDIAQQLEIVHRNPLPNLQDLIICLSGVYEPEFPADLISPILNKFHLQLRDFALHGYPHEDDFVRPTCLKFPVMKELRNLLIHNVMWKLETPISNLNEVFPKLRSLELHQQSRKMLTKWVSTTSEPVNSVEELSLKLVNALDLEAISMDRGKMASVHRTFPHLRKLDIEVCGKVKKTLQCLFQNMQQLQHLRINVVDDKYKDDTNEWDSVLTGIPETYLSNGEVVGTPVARLPSIQMLSELKSLYLDEDICLAQNKTRPLISDLVFTHALNKMPSLQRVTMFGGFVVSDAIKEDWNGKLGRKLEYKKVF